MTDGGAPQHTGKPADREAADGVDRRRLLQAAAGAGLAATAGGVLADRAEGALDPKAITITVPRGREVNVKKTDNPKAEVVVSMSRRRVERAKGTLVSLFQFSSPD